jgi:hypothetical protein
MCLRESQPESESAKRAAAAWRGGRVLIGIQRFIEPHRQTRRWGFCLEHFPQSCSAELGIRVDRGLFDFWRRFGSVAGWPMEPAPSPKPGQKSKILAAQHCIFSVNALVMQGYRGYN